MDETAKTLSVSQAYEAAYRFVWQYAQRVPDSAALELMLVAMEPVADYARTNDPASWADWAVSVEDVHAGRPVPRFPRT
jgi:hypothetical protein